MSTAMSTDISVDITQSKQDPLPLQWYQRQGSRVSRSRGLRFRNLGASFSRFRGLCFRDLGVFVFEFRVLRFRVLGASFLRFGCFVLRSSFSSASFSKVPLKKYEVIVQ